MMTAETLAAIRERAEKATPGPWEVVADHRVLYISESGEEAEYLAGVGMAYSAKHNHNAEFIAHAREDVPALLAEVEQLRLENQKWELSAISRRKERDAAYARLDKARALHVFESVETGGGDAEIMCAACHYVSQDDETDPCPTIQALDGGDQ